MKHILLISLFILALTGQVFANNEPVLLVTGVVTEIHQFSRVSTFTSGYSKETASEFSFKSLTVTTPSKEPFTPDFQTRVVFIGDIHDRFLGADVSTDEGEVIVVVGDVVTITARSSFRQIGFQGQDLRLFVATIEHAELHEGHE